MEATSENLPELQQAQEALAQLSAERLKIAVEFIAYLQEKESREATEELLTIPNFLEELEEAEEEVRSGAVVSFESIRRDV
ncbi:hypothetical protein V0288_01275 [Pannus brasiliensis CCIBt3594]|uniref:Uncharacterized protein n=1 Tax=Pannus brasiliensis CCIBt3594 TaxID=1427578 RepID=A0AAW9QD96_9CHRO